MRNEENISFSQTGSGDSILFIHGFLGDKTIWESSIKQLSAKFNCITFDLPGHGENQFNKQLDLQATLRLITDFISRKKIKRYHIVGHSLGGYIGLELLNQDHRADKLILASSNVKADSAEKKAKRMRSIQAIENGAKNIVLDSVIRKLFFDYKKNELQYLKSCAIARKVSPEKMIEYTSWMIDRKSHENDPKIAEGKIFQFHGANDQSIPLEEVPLKRGLSHIEKKAGHLTPLECPDSLSKQIEMFLK